jgi:hypothetical protein
MFELERKADYVLFSKSRQPVGTAVFLIDDLWRAVGDLAEVHKGLSLDHSAMSDIVYRNSLGPNVLVTGLSAWKFAAHPDVNRVYAGRFLDDARDWVKGVLEADRSLLNSLFFVDHWDSNRGEVAAYDSIQLLRNSGIPNYRIFSFTIGGSADVSDKLLEDFGILPEQEIGKFDLEARPVEVMTDVFDFVAAHSR